MAELVSRLESTYYVDLDAAIEAVRQRTSFNLIHADTGLKVDIFVPERHAFSQQELARARLDTLDPSPEARQFFVKSQEDLILRKLLWFRAGHEVSERQWSDVLGILKVQGDRLDHAYLDQWAAQLSLTDLLERAVAAAVER